MAFYTNQDKVAGIIELEDPNAEDLIPFIESAHQLIVAVCLESGYTDGELELIERWLAAHFYDHMKPRVAADAVTGAVGVSERFENITTDLGLNVTKYGQQAMRMDYFGNLAALDNKLKKTLGVKKKFTWLGDPCNVERY